VYNKLSKIIFKYNSFLYSVFCCLLPEFLLLPMKWILTAIVASVLVGCYVYDEFDPGTCMPCCYNSWLYFCSTVVEPYWHGVPKSPIPLLTGSHFLTIANFICFPNSEVILECAGFRYRTNRLINISWLDVKDVFILFGFVTC